MKVLVSDTMGEAGLEIFRNQDGIELDVKTGLSPDELKEIQAAAARINAGLSSRTLEAKRRGIDVFDIELFLYLI